MLERPEAEIPEPVIRLIEKARADERILASWLEGAPAQYSRYVEMHLALTEEGLASFWAERRLWLADVSPVWINDVRDLGTGCTLLTEEGVLLVLQMEPWGSVPERPRRHPHILFDKTGRLRKRLRGWQRPERVEFQVLDRLAADVWLSIWTAAVMRSYDAAGYVGAVAAAMRAYLAFVAACMGQDVEDVAWAGRLAEAAGFESYQVMGWSSREMAEALIHLMSTRGRALGEARGWQYPLALERIARSVWEEKRGDE